MAKRPSGEFSSAGVHSMVWILAMSAALTSRAFWNSHSPSAVGIIDPQPIDDGVVLAREQRVHHREADPPVAVHAGELVVRDRLAAVDRCRWPAVSRCSLPSGQHLRRSRDRVRTAR